MRSSKIHEPQPYLEPNSPRSTASGVVPPSEASSLSVATQAMGLEGLDQEEQKHTPDVGKSDMSTESEPREAGAGEEGGAASSTSATTCESGEEVRVIVTEADHEEQRDSGVAESEQDQEQHGTGMGTRVGEEEEVKVKPAPGSLYADLGDFEPVNLLSFAYQIASGMVSEISTTGSECCSIYKTHNRQVTRK